MPPAEPVLGAIRAGYGNQRAENESPVAPATPIAGRRPGVEPTPLRRPGATIHGAFTRGYDTVLVGDAHTTEDFTQYGMPPADKVIAHTNAYWSEHDGPGRQASVVETADVSFDASEPADQLSPNR